MAEQPVVRDDSASEHQSPLELSREPRVSARDISDTSDAHDADGADEHESHDPYQPL